jgi:hypothetical protein
MGPLEEQRNVAANALLTQFKAAGIAIRGNGLSHNISLPVLAKTAAPACLIEYGFHTNQGDVAKLKDPAYRDKLAIATAKGVCNYFGVAYKEETKPNAAGVAEWAKDAVAWAKENGIISGDENGNFGLLSNTSKQEQCLMLYRFYQLIKSGK